MKTRLILLIAFTCIAMCVSPARGQRQDPLGDVMIPPQLILQYADAIGLDASQKEFIESKFRQVQEKFPELQRDLQKEVAALAELMKQEKPDEEKVLDQLDKVLNGERAIKRAQISLAIAVRNKLTPQQVAKAREMQQKMMADARNRGPGNGPTESLRAKAQQVQQIAMQMQQQGKDPSPLREAMEQVQQLMQQGKAKEAEEVLDRVVRQFSGDAPPQSPKPDAPKKPASEGPRS